MHHAQKGTVNCHPVSITGAAPAALFFFVFLCYNIHNEKTKNSRCAPDRLYKETGEEYGIDPPEETDDPFTGPAALMRPYSGRQR